ncbi:MAG: hypothetical protein HZR80_16350 [Candidatus Heimdallarchaeota archaeon]
MKSLRDRKLFFIQKIFSKAASVKLLRKIGTFYVEIMTRKKPFSLDNLGLLDKHFQDIDLSKIPPIETFYGGITSLLDAIIVLFYTIRGEMHFIYHYTKNKFSSKEIKTYAETILQRLANAVGM